MKKKKCYGGKLLYSFLLKNNYINEYRKLIKPIDISDINKIVDELKEVRVNRISSRSLIEMKTNKIESKSSTKVLYDVLKDFNKTGKFYYTQNSLMKSSCLYSKYLSKFLKKEKYMDVNYKMLKPVPISNMEETIKLIRDSYYGRKKEIESNKYLPTKQTNENTYNLSLDEFNDVQIVTELRKRGYDVLAKKIVEL